MVFRSVGGKPKEQSSATKKGGVVIYKVGTDNIITEATNRLSARLKSKYGEDSVVLFLSNLTQNCYRCCHTYLNGIR
jgi:hypothetical protein